MIRAVRFIREWRGKIGRDDKRDEYLTFGQRELLVMRGFAEWEDAEKPATPQRKGKNQRESAVEQQ